MPKSKPGALQNYILTTCYKKKSKRLRKLEIFKYYTEMPLTDLQKKNPGRYNKLHSTIITTIERMIKASYLNGYGYRSPKEWHFKEISLTPKGKKKARSILSIKKLPLRY